MITTIAKTAAATVLAVSFSAVSLGPAMAQEVGMLHTTAAVGKHADPVTISHTLLASQGTTSGGVVSNTGRAIHSDGWNLCGMFPEFCHRS